jgi:hypothetical protein
MGVIHRMNTDPITCGMLIACGTLETHSEMALEPAALSGARAGRFQD